MNNYFGKSVEWLAKQQDSALYVSFLSSSGMVLLGKPGFLYRKRLLMDKKALKKPKKSSRLIADLKVMFTFAHDIVGRTVYFRVPIPGK